MLLQVPTGRVYARRVELSSDERAFLDAFFRRLEPCGRTEVSRQLDPGPERQDNWTREMGARRERELELTGTTVDLEQRGLVLIALSSATPRRVTARLHPGSHTLGSC